MKLYVEPMDATAIEVGDDGRVLLEGGEWIAPTLQERRAIVYAAETEIAALQELVRKLEGP